MVISQLLLETFLHRHHFLPIPLIPFVPYLPVKQVKFHWTSSIVKPKEMHSTLLRKVITEIQLRWFPSFSLRIPTAHDVCVISARKWARARTQNVRDFPQTKPDSEINARFLLKCPYRQNFYFLIRFYIALNELLRKKNLIWMKCNLF